MGQGRGEGRGLSCVLEAIFRTWDTNPAMMLCLGGRHICPDATDAIHECTHTHIHTAGHHLCSWVRVEKMNRDSRWNTWSEAYNCLLTIIFHIIGKRDFVGLDMAGGCYLIWISYTRSYLDPDQINWMFYSNHLTLSLIGCYTQSRMDTLLEIQQLSLNPDKLGAAKLSKLCL